MSLADIIGTVGVSMLLIAFVLNQRERLSEHSRGFLAMNLVGAESIRMLDTSKQLARSSSAQKCPSATIWRKGFLRRWECARRR